METKNNLALTTTQKSLRIQQEKATKVIKAYGDNKSFFNIFTPAKTPVYSRHPYRCVNGTAPTMYDLKAAYGSACPIQWLEIQLVALSEFSGAREKITEFQLTHLANIFYTDFGYLKVSEFMLFFHMVESGRFGQLDWGKFDPIRLTMMLQEFLSVRASYIEQKEQKEREERERNRKPVPPPDFVLKNLKRVQQLGILTNVLNETDNKCITAKPVEQNTQPTEPTDN